MTIDPFIVGELKADGGKDSSDALFNACMTREIDPTGTPKEVIDRIIDWEISLERADGGKGDEHDSRMWDAGYSAGIDFERRRNAPQAECDSDAEREAFEAWANERELDLMPGYPGQYSDCNTDFAWGAWQARAALSARADGGKDSSHHDPSWQEGYKEGYDDSRLVALDEAAKVAYSHNAIMATTTAQLIEKAIRALIGVKK